MANTLTEYEREQLLKRFQERLRILKQDEGLAEVFVRDVEDVLGAW